MQSKSFKNSSITLLVIGILSSALSCQKPSENSRIDVEGFWFTKIPEMTVVEPLKDGQHAWAISRGVSTQHGKFEGLYIIDRNGRKLNAHKPLLETTGDLEVWPAQTGDMYRAWVNRDDNNHTLSLVEVNKNPANDMPSIETTRIQNFQLPGPDNNSTIEIIPAVEGSSAWIKAGGTIYFIDPNKSGSPFRKLLENLDNPRVIAFGSKKRAWIYSNSIITNKKGVYLVDATNGVLHDGQPYLRDIVARNVIPLADENHALVVQETFSLSVEEIHFIKASGEEINLNQTLLHGSPITAYSHAEHPNQIWIAPKENDRGVILISVFQGLPKIVKRFLEGVPVGKIFSAKDGNSAWAISDDGKQLYSINTKENGDRNYSDLLPSGGNFQAIYQSEDNKYAWVVIKMENAPEIIQILNPINQETNKRASISFDEEINRITPIPNSNLAIVSSVGYTDPFSPDAKVYVINVINTNGNILNGGSPIIAGRDLLSEKQDNKQVWLGGDLTNRMIFQGEILRSIPSNNTYVLGDSSYLDSALVVFNNASNLEYSKNEEKLRNSFYLSAGAKIESATVTVKPEGQSSQSLDGTVQIFLKDNGTGEIIERSAMRSLKEGPSVQLNWQPKFNHPYTVTLHYKNQFGGVTDISWANVEFTVPLLARPLVRTGLAFALICVVGILLFTIRPLSISVRRWLPLMCLAFGGWGGFSQWAKDWNINGPVFVGLIIGAVVISVPASLISPHVFRVLAQVQPFHALVPLTLTWPRMRGRLFNPYAERLKEQLLAERQKSNYEVYIPVPADLKNNTSPTQARPVSQPADEILKRLSDEINNRYSVLVESPGGRGKSALIREVSELSVERFLKNPQSPLPVICEPKGKSINEMMISALGRYLISEDSLDAELKSGHFIVVLDGLSESSIEADTIEKFVKSDAGEATPLLIASRPSDNFRNALQKADRWMIFEPKRLDAITYKVFEDGYLEHDEELKKKGETHLTSSPLADAVKEICKGPDKTYLPILVRLAMLAGGKDLRTVAEIYEETFNRLLRPDESTQRNTLLDQASKLCVETYWNTGQRTIMYSAVGKERIELLNRLLNAGVLVSADAAPRTFGGYREVRFFHDSMQSYLTARGLFGENTSWTTKLAEAAAATRFREGQQSQASYSIPEIYQMCLHVFGPRELLRRALKSDLELWATEHDVDIKKRDVLEAVPIDIRKILEIQVASEMGSGVMLLKAVELCTEKDGLDSNESLGVLYARIAAVVWEPSKS